MKIKSFMFFASSALLISAGDMIPSAIYSDQQTTVYASTSRTVNIQPIDFLTYFKRNGSAAQYDYDLSTYTQTLTPNLESQSGNVTLKNKIDMSEDFQLKGLINLGDKGQKPDSARGGGADGLGIMFQPGDTNTVGSSGNGLGIGGVQEAFGFKFDTYYNGITSNNAMPDPVQFAPANNNVGGQSFGAFVDGRTGTAITESNDAQAIPQPSKNQFLPFSISYVGATQTLTVQYNGQTWSRNVSNWIGSNKSMSLAITSSTGWSYNLQQLRNISFNYTVAQGTVNARYVDESSNNIADSSTTNGDLGADYNTTQKDIPGYSFKEVTGSPVSGKYTANDQTVTYVYTRNQGNADVKYIDDTDNQVLSRKNLSGNTSDKADYSTAETIQNYEDQGYELVKDNYPKDGVTYTDDAQHYEVHLSHKITETTESKTVNETVHYVYQDGKKASDDYKATPVTFTRTVSTDAVTGEKTYGNWSTDQEFDAVNSPKIKGYTPDKEQIDKQTVNGDSNDLEFTVTYTKNDVPLTPVEPIAPEGKTPQSPTVNVTFNKAGQTPVLNKETVGKLPHTGTQVDVTKSLSLSALILGLTATLLLSLKRKFK